MRDTFFGEKQVLERFAAKLVCCWTYYLDWWVAGIPAGRSFLSFYFALYFCACCFCTRKLFFTRLCARRRILTAYTFGPVWPVSSFYVSSMDYFPPLLHLRLKYFNNLKSNVPRDPSAKIRYTGGNPGRYTFQVWIWTQRQLKSWIIFTIDVQS